VVTPGSQYTMVAWSSHLPGSVGDRMHLTLGFRAYDLTTRALVIAAAGTGPEGADLMEVAGPHPLFMTAEDDAGVERAVAAGAALVRVPEPTAGVRRRCAAAGVALVEGSLFLDVTGADCPTAAVAVGVIRGARLVRTTDARGARRVCDVLAAVLEAR